MGKNKEVAPSGRKSQSMSVRPALSTSPWEREVEHWFDDFRRRFGLPSMRDEGWWPFGARTSGWGALDVFDQDGEIVVKADLPGVAKDDLEVTLTGNRVTVRAHKKHESEVKEEQYFRSERTFGEVTRSVELPGEVDPEKVKASFQDGVLEIRLAKTKSAKQGPRKVPVA